MNKESRIEWLKMVGVTALFVAFLAAIPLMGIIFPEIVVSGDAREAFFGILGAGGLVIFIELAVII